MLDEAKDYHLMPERRLLLQSFRTRPRCVSYIRGHIYAVGGLTKSGIYILYINHYSHNVYYVPNLKYYIILQYPFMELNLIFFLTCGVK